MISRFATLLTALLVVSCLANPQNVQAQVLTTAIGGVHVDANGVLDTPAAASVKDAAEMMRERMQRVPANLRDKTEFRMVSLHGLQTQIQNAVDQGQPIPDEVRYLAGLQRIQFVLVNPEKQDIVLAGPAEGWTVDAWGAVVGETTGQPVVLLDDLMVALRSAEAARTVGITCSIDPTAEGRVALQRFLNRQKRFHPTVAKQAEQILGDQEISITGVPQDSHFARVLVAADYRMKRFAMMLEPAPVSDMPSFLELLRQRRGGLNNMMPRWWMACDYDPVQQSEDGLAWEIRGRGVKVMTEDEVISGQGGVRGSGKVNPVAQEWADNMTSQYTELSKADTVFGQLRNVMDAALAAAIIERYDLSGLAACDLSILKNEGTVASEKWPVPKTVGTQSSFVKVGRQYVITASGGVQIDSWKWAAQTESSKQLEQHLAKLDEAADDWTWSAP